MKMLVLRISIIVKNRKEFETVDIFVTKYNGGVERLRNFLKNESSSLYIDIVL